MLSPPIVVELFNFPSIMTHAHTCPYLRAFNAHIREGENNIVILYFALTFEKLNILRTNTNTNHILCYNVLSTINFRKK